MDTFYIFIYLFFSTFLYLYFEIFFHIFFISQSHCMFLNITFSNITPLDIFISNYMQQCKKSNLHATVHPERWNCYRNSKLLSMFWCNSHGQVETTCNSVIHVNPDSHATVWHANPDSHATVQHRQFHKFYALIAIFLN